MDSELDAIRSKEDIVSLSTGREWAMFDSGVEKSIHWLDGALKKVFRTEKHPLEVRTSKGRVILRCKEFSFFSFYILRQDG